MDLWRWRKLLSSLSVVNDTLTCMRLSFTWINTLIKLFARNCVHCYYGIRSGFLEKSLEKICEDRVNLEAAEMCMVPITWARDRYDVAVEPGKLEVSG